MKRFLAICLFLSPVMLAGCSTYDNNVVGTKKLLTDDQLGRVDLALLIWADVDKESPLEVRPVTSKKQNNESGSMQSLRIKKALNHFDEEFVLGKNPTTNFEAKYKRDDIQSVLIQASNERCLEWQNFAFSQKARTNFWLSGASFVSTAASTIVTGEADIKAWSAGAGALNSVAGSYDKQFLANSTTQVILEGIQLAKDTRLKAIKDERKKNIAEYTLSASIADALNYHAACSINGGLVEVARQLPKEPK